MSLYAVLNPARTTVVKIEDKDPALVAAFIAANNPKVTYWRVVNMTPQPVFNPNTQVVVQNGWTITTVDVQPIWQIVALDSAGQEAVAAQNEYQNMIAASVVTDLHNALNNWAILTTLQKDTVLKVVARVSAALLRAQFGVST